MGQCCSRADSAPSHEGPVDYYPLKKGEADGGFDVVRSSSAILPEVCPGPDDAGQALVPTFVLSLRCKILVVEASRVELTIQEVVECVYAPPLAQPVAVEREPPRRVKQEPIEEVLSDVEGQWLIGTTEKAQTQESESYMKEQGVLASQGSFCVSSDSTADNAPVGADALPGLCRASRGLNRSISINSTASDDSSATDAPQDDVWAVGDFLDCDDDPMLVLCLWVCEDGFVQVSFNILGDVEAVPEGMRRAQSETQVGKVAPKGGQKSGSPQSPRSSGNSSRRTLRRAQTCPSFSRGPRSLLPKSGPGALPPKCPAPLDVKSLKDLLWDWGALPQVYRSDRELERQLRGMVEVMRDLIYKYKLGINPEILGYRYGRTHVDMYKDIKYVIRGRIAPHRDYMARYIKRYEVNID